MNREESVVAILNPTSGRNRGGTRADELRREFDRMGVGCEFKLTEGPGHATKLAKEATDQGVDIVAACGGDGTLNEVLNGLIGSGAAIAPVPLGTGNDFTRTIGFGTDWRSAVQAIAERRMAQIDLGVCHAGSESRYFLNVAGCGFDVAVAERIQNGIKKLRGPAAYVIGVLAELAHFQAQPMSLEIDGAVERVDAMLCAVANAQSYGGSMKVAPTARIDDGVFDVVVLNRIGKLRFLRRFPSVFKGTHLRFPEVKHLQCKTILIEPDRVQSVLLDGEIFGPTPATFELIPCAINCVVANSFVQYEPTKLE